MMMSRLSTWSTLILNSSSQMMEKRVKIMGALTFSLVFLKRSLEAINGPFLLEEIRLNLVAM